MNDTAREVYYLKTLSVAKNTHPQWHMTEICVQSTGGMLQTGKPMYRRKPYVAASLTTINPTKK